QQDYAFHHTMIPAYVTWNDIRQVQDVCAGIYGDDAEFVAFELSQGYDNDTVAADQALWELAQVWANHDETRFSAALDDFLRRYGRRAETWTIGSPTWAEKGPGFWAQLRHLSSPDVAAPAESLRKAAQRRVQLIDEIDAKLAGDEALRARFHRRVERLAHYVVVREERANWQLVISGAVRHALLRHGEKLVASGRLEQPDDILFLLPEEVDHLPSDARSLVAERRQEHERRKQLRPPEAIGGPAERPDGVGREGALIR